MATTGYYDAYSWEGGDGSGNQISGSKTIYCSSTTPGYFYYKIFVGSGSPSGGTVYFRGDFVGRNTTNNYTLKLTIGSNSYTYSGSQYFSQSGTRLYHTFNNVSFPSMGTYLYPTIQFYPSSSSIEAWPNKSFTYGNDEYKKTQLNIEYTEVTSCGAPTSIWGQNDSGKDRVIPGQNFTFYWSGASGGTQNNVAGYDIAYKYSGDSDWIYPSDAEGTSYNFTPSEHRGQTLQFKVRTKGSYSTSSSTYWSSWAYSENYIINTEPPKPSVATNTSYYSWDNGGSITFTASVDADAEEDSLKIYYSTDSSFSSEKEYTEPFTVTFDKGTSSATYYFRTWDEHEYSSAIASTTVYRNTPPVIASLGLRYTSLPGKLSGETYIRIISTQPNVSKSVSYTWYLVHNSSKTASGATYTYLSTSANIGINLTNYKGEYVRLKLIVNDGYDIRYLESQWFFVPTSPSSASEVTITNASGKNAVDPINSVLYTGGTIYMSWSLPEATDSQLSRYSYVELQKYNEDGSWSIIKTYPETTSTTAAASYTRVYSLPSDIEYNTIYRIIVYTKEVSPGTQSAGYIYTTNTLQRAPKPALASEGPSLYVEPEIIRPTSGNTGALGGTSSGSDLVFIHSVEDTSPNLGAKWTLTATVNGQAIVLMDKKEVSATQEGITSETVDGKKIKHTFSNAKWVSLFSQPTWNNSHTATITLSLENYLGDSVKAITSTTLTADYQEPARWMNANSLLTKKIKYTDNLIGGSLTGAGSKSNNATFLVNAGEKVQLTIPEITDLNNDTNKDVYVERGIISDWSDDLDKIKSASNWTQVDTFKPSKTTICEYTIPDISEDAFYVFRAWIKGSNTLESKGSYVSSDYQYAYSPTVVRACRSQKPLIEIKNVSDTESSSGVFTITPLITLRGSTDYTNYKNWERAGVLTGYPTKNITITAEICSDGLFDKTKTTYASGTFLDAYSGEYSNVNAANFSTISKADFKNMTLFLRLNISLDTGFGKILENTSPIYTFYAMTPTVSHRSHQVGINTNKFNTGEIFALAMPSSDKKKLRFTGEEGASAVNLFLDLSTLTLSSNIGAGENDEFSSKIKFGTGTEAKITDFNLSKCTATTSFKGSVAGVILDNFSIDGGTW